jgi:hypothetical protein
MGVTEEAGKVATTITAAMQSQPLAIALLVVNVMFLGFAGWVLSAVAVNAAERNKTQMELIGRLVTECRGTGPRAGPSKTPALPLPALPAVPINN